MSMLAGEKHGGQGADAEAQRKTPEVRPYAPDDRAAVLDFRRATWPDAAIRDPSYFRWQYEDSPLGPPGERLWVARAEDRIVGHVGALPVDLLMAGRPLRAGWLIELFVDPAQRGRGLAQALEGRLSAAHDLTLAVEISFAAQNVFLRAGWTDLGTLPLWWRPLDLGAVLSARLPGVLPGPVLSALGRVVREGDRALLAATALHGPELRHVPRFGSDVDGLFRDLASRTTVLCRRDARWWNWRFADHPATGRYRLYEARHREQLVGAVVLRIGERFGLRTAWIVDHVTAQGWTRPVLARALEAARDLGAAACYMYWRGPHAEEATRLGFLRRESGLRLMMRGDRLPPAAVLLLSDPRRWHLTGAESNLDRPRPPGEDL